jgi:hypothetical protein
MKTLIAIFMLTLSMIGAANAQTVNPQTGIKDDHRKKVFLDDLNYRFLWTLGSVSVAEKNNPTKLLSEATGFLVSPCYILTNYHVAVADIEGRGKTTFSLPITIGDSPAVSAAKPVLFGNISNKDDWALLKLEKCLGTQAGWMEIANKTDREYLGLKVGMAGYPYDIFDYKNNVNPSDQGGVAYEEGCITSYRTDEPETLGTVYNTCTTNRGASGSPIFSIGDAYPSVVAIVSTNDLSGSYANLYHTNHGVDIRLAYARISSLIEQDKKSVPTGNPALNDYLAFKRGFQ